MPVPAAYLSLATAKTWAKRLAKTSKQTDPQHSWPLARCQLAVATMLGYDHWHALNQALGDGVNTSQETHTPAVGGARDLRKLQALALPSEPAAWPGFLKELLDIDGGGGDVSLDIRAEAATLRVRVHGQLVSMGPVDSQDAIEGIMPLLPIEIGEKLRLGLRGGHDPAMGGGHINGIIELPNHLGDRPRLQAVPVYPQGMDLVFRAQPATDRAHGQLAGMNLPADALRALRRACSFDTGAFFFTGTTGSGKSGLMDAVVNDRVTGREGRRAQRVYTVEDPPEYRIPRLASIPVIRQKNEKTVVAGTAIDEALRGHPGLDVLVVGEVRDEFSADVVFKAATSGIAAFSTCHSTAAGLPERLADMGISDKDCQGRLRGWAYTRLLPVLCPHCSAPFNAIHGLRSRGQGCDKCAGLGISGRQIVIDLWQIEGGERKQVCSCMDQARDLIRKGRVSYSDVQELMGPVGL